MTKILRHSKYGQTWELSLKNEIPPSSHLHCDVQEGCKLYPILRIAPFKHVYACNNHGNAIADSYDYNPDKKMLKRFAKIDNEREGKVWIIIKD